MRLAGLLTRVVGMATVCFATVAAQTPPDPNKYIGSQVCQACHPDLWHGFNRNPHFKSIALAKAPLEKTGCEGCHGPGELHVKGMGG